MTIETTTPRVRIRLLKDYRPAATLSADVPILSEPAELAELRAQLAAVPALEAVELIREGHSTVVAEVPASNQRQRNRMKDLLGKAIRGWTVIDDSSYRLPSSF